MGGAKQETGEHYRRQETILRGGYKLATREGGKVEERRREHGAAAERYGEWRRQRRRDRTSALTQARCYYLPQALLLLLPRVNFGQQNIVGSSQADAAGKVILEMRWAAAPV